MANDEDSRDERSGVLKPGDLDITERENVLELEEGRFVISPSGQPNPPPSDNDDRIESVDDGDRTDEISVEKPPNPDGDHVRRDAGLRLANCGGRYGFSISAKFDDRIVHRRLSSNDIVTTFEQLLLWFAEQVDDETPVDEVLGILLAEAHVPTRPPAADLRRLLAKNDIDEEDSVGKLLDVVEDGSDR